MSGTRGKSSKAESKAESSAASHAASSAFTGNRRKSIVGHSKLMQSLFTAAASGALAPSMIFSGVSGVGKRQVAWALAQALICEKGLVQANGEAAACATCGSCLRVARGQSESVLEIIPDGASIKIEQAREVLQFFNLRALGRARVVIIDQAHLLNVQAANTLLKTLEEPPASAYFILITAQATSLLPTIRSRSQTVRFQPLSDEELERVLSAETDPWIVRAAEGSVEAARRLESTQAEFRELETCVLNYLERSMTALPVEEISLMREAFKDRPAMSFAIKRLQSALVDGLRLRHTVATRAGSKSRAIQGLARLPEPKLLELCERSLSLEYDLHHNVDRGLALESFALQIKSQQTRLVE